MSGPGRPTADSAALISQRLLDSAWAVLLEAGPEQLSLERVAVLAGSSKQTLYARHAGKLELLQAVLDARVGSLFGAMRELKAAPDALSAFTDLAERSVASMVASDVQMLERLVDWIDVHRTDGENGALRPALYNEVHDQILDLLRDADARWQLGIADIPAATVFWLDGVVGHVRCFPSGHSDGWAATYAALFLRAVGR